MDDDVEYLTGGRAAVERLGEASPVAPFSTATVEFLHALHQEIARDPATRLFPDVATFGFFCRRPNLFALRDKHRGGTLLRVGRGVAFHIAPSNVPVNFAYSLVAGLIAGNANIVRVPSRDFEQVRLIGNAIARVAAQPEHRDIGGRIFLVRYERTGGGTAYFSKRCDVRIIWGGDETVEDIRRAPLPAQAHELTFADRYSFGVIDAGAFLAHATPEKVAEGFYNDTYLFDQNACTAPHLLIWLGSAGEVAAAKERFWNAVHTVVAARHKELEAVVAVSKLTQFCAQAVEFAGTKRGDSPDNLVWRTELTQLRRGIEEFRCIGGYFSEYHAQSLAEIPGIVSRKFQTMCYFGLEKAQLETFVTSTPMVGIDRIVPIGRTLDFSLTWDGYDLVSELSRIVDVR